RRGLRLRGRLRARLAHTLRVLRRALRECQRSTQRLEQARDTEPLEESTTTGYGGDRGLHARLRRRVMRDRRNARKLLRSRFTSKEPLRLRPAGGGRFSYTLLSTGSPTRMPRSASAPRMKSAAAASSATNSSGRTPAAPSPRSTPSRAVAAV